jgi:NDP-sugar pyrophosphorylase family protein
MLSLAILAGGLAVRLRPATETIPKALIEIGGEPFLAHQLRLLNRGGITRAVLCVGYRGEAIRDYAGDGSRFGLQLEYSFDGPQLLGTAGAIRRALPMLGDAFFVVYGDSYLPCDYKAVEEAFIRSRKQGLMTVFRNHGQWDGSNVEYAGGRIVAYDKVNRTSRMQHIDYGLGAFRASAFDKVPEGHPADLAGVYQRLLRRGELAAFESMTRFYEIGSFAGIRELEALLVKQPDHTKEEPLT